VTSLTVGRSPRPKLASVFRLDRGEWLMGNVIDLRMVRYLIEQFRLPVAEAVRVDMAIAAEYGLVPAPPPARADRRGGAHGPVRRVLA
jgi:hypothetical protein